MVIESLYSLPPRAQYLVYHALSLHNSACPHDPTDRFTPQIEAGYHSPVTLSVVLRKIVHMDIRRMLGSQDTMKVMA